MCVRRVHVRVHALFACCVQCPVTNIRFLSRAGAVEQELRELFGYACPTVTTMVMFYLANVVTMAFVGQLGPVDLAAAGLATMFCNVCSYQFMHS